MYYYKTNFGLMQYHKYSLTEIEDMIPFEKEAYDNDKNLDYLETRKRYSWLKNNGE